jgi:hypothetical protein
MWEDPDAYNDLTFGLGSDVPSATHAYNILLCQSNLVVMLGCVYSGLAGFESERSWVGNNIMWVSQWSQERELLQVGRAPEEIATAAPFASLTPMGSKLHTWLPNH